jgi:hypothetical protein
MMQSSIRFYWRDSRGVAKFRSGVSLHSHTMHSRENLTFVPLYARRIPLLRSEFARLERRHRAATGTDVDFAAAYWTPPMSSHGAFELEKNQIERTYGLRGFVSLTDHDNIEAGCQLQLMEADIPISIEWTVPFEDTFFHLGVHNLPPESARDIAQAMAACTGNPDRRLLFDILAEVKNAPGTIIVFNHPFWDQAGIGTERHSAALQRFLKELTGFVHALELNGLRPWDENRATVAMASEWKYPVISGGDRHGSEPNAAINLTDSGSFAEFAAEVRDGVSHVMFLPQYREPLTLRILGTLCDVLRDMPELAGRERWTDRVHFSPAPGTRVPLSSKWTDDGPAIVRYFVKCVCLFGHRRVQRALRPLLEAEHEFAM